jgi:hypothetical protein
LAQSFFYKAFTFSPSDTFWDKVKKIRKFCQQEIIKLQLDTT